MTIENVLKKYEGAIIGLPNVTAVGIEKREGKDRILVFVTEKIPESRLEKSAIIPKKIETFETVVQKERRKNK